MEKSIEETARIKASEKYGGSMHPCNSCQYEAYQEGFIDSRKSILPTYTQIEEAIAMLSKESTAPDQETPTWLQADIRRGINWALDYVKNNTI